jgi:hypothetical protein
MKFREFVALALIALLSAIAGAAVHARQNNSTSTSPQQGQNKAKPSNANSMDDMPDMPGMDHNSSMQTEAGADQEMTHGHHHMGAHMYMTKLRAASDSDWARADHIAAELRDAIEPYRDYRVALASGFRPFLPNVPQDIYHFTNYQNGFLESFTFDPARPTSLLYRKTSSGYELVGAMYTMPRSATEDQLNARIPLSVAQWHQHTNLCIPPRGMSRADIMNSKEFGLEGSISTKEGCDAAGGRFFPVVLGWMVHVYPFEPTREKVWEQ